MNKYFLLASGSKPTKNNDLVDFVTTRKEKKDIIWKRRNDRLVEMATKLDLLLSIYTNSGGHLPTVGKNKSLLYRSALAHQIWNTLQSTKLEPDFIDYAPLGAQYDLELRQKARELTQAHRTLRYKGDFDKAKAESKADSVWGNSFIEMSTRFEDDTPICTEYTNAPWKEMRNLYGDTDIMRIIDYSVELYSSIYGEEELRNVALGGITETKNINTTNPTEREYNSQKDIIQVVRYYDPTRKIFAEIHGSNGHIYKSLEGSAYPFIWKNDEGFAPFKEFRFFEQVTGDYFGWGVMDYVIDLANLETTTTNATALEAIWDASAPSFIFSNDPDDMEKKMDKHLRSINSGINKPIIQKDSGIGTKGQIQSLKKGVDNRNMQVWDETTISRATRFSNVDVQALSDYAPTAEQQKLKKLEADKLNIRVLMLNEQREKEFAIKEMAFLQNGKTKFHNYEINVIDAISEQFKSEDGSMPTNKKKIGDILNGVNSLELKISPRMEGVLDDMDFMEIQTMQEDIRNIQPGTAAYDIAMEKYFEKKNPDWGLKREDFSTPTMPQQGEQGAPSQEGIGSLLDPANGLTKQLATA